MFALVVWLYHESAFDAKDPLIRLDTLCPWPYIKSTLFFGSVACPKLCTRYFQFFIYPERFKSLYRHLTYSNFSFGLRKTTANFISPTVLQKASAASNVDQRSGGESEEKRLRSRAAAVGDAR